VPSEPAVVVDHVSLRKGDRTIVDDLTWTVSQPDRWVILGPNGSGKTSLIQLISGYDHPTTGTVDILGSRLGRVDVRRLRTRIGIASASLAQRMRPTVEAIDVVLSGRHAALETWWHDYTDADRKKARLLLEQGGFGYLADQPFGVLSEGERQQVQLARTLMGDPELVLLDEPCAGLDVGGRERFVTGLANLAASPDTPPIVFVTHHVEEVPPGFTHGLLLRTGRAVAQGPVEDVLTSANLTTAFGLDLDVRKESGRFTCRAR
jgi:iron complex transport system ATP-binding protein